MTGLLHWLWEGALLAAGLGLVLECTRRLTARTKYILWCVALAVTLCLPLARMLPDSLPSILPAGAAAASPADPSAAPGSRRPAVAPTTFDVDTALVTVPAAPDWLLSCLVGVWIGTMGVAGGRIIQGVRTLAHLRRTARTLPPSLARWLDQRLTQPERGRRFDVRSSSAITGACALGLSRRPIVLLSERVIATLDRHDLELIVRHEQAHLARYDDWAALLESCVLAIVGLHPAVRFMCARLNHEREAACDDAVAVDTGDARRYATCLADAADAIGGGQRRGRIAVIPHAGTGSLLSRVRRLLDPRIVRSSAPQPLALAAGGVGVFAVAVIATGLGPILISTDRPAGNAIGLVARSHAANSTPSNVLPLIGEPRERSIPATAAAVPPPVSRRRSGGIAPVPAARTPRSEGVLPARPRASDLVVGSGIGVVTSDAGAIRLDAARSSSGLGHEPAVAEVPLLAATPHPMSLGGPTAAGSATWQWTAAGEAGVVVGRHVGRWGTAAGVASREAGGAIGGYFSRAGKAVAEGF